MGTGRKETDTCTRGHDMSVYRKFHPNGDSYCSACKKIRYKKFCKEQPDRLARYNRVSKLRKAYGIDIKGYNAILDAQGGVCAICKCECLSGRHLAVDHDHETGDVRGLLCSRCNTAIGLLRDDETLFTKAIEYLGKKGK